ncbi:MAG: AAA family ATPase, partial [Candidatus Binatia bacterium]
MRTPPHLVERILAEQAALESRAVSDGERKTITALFADIKGSVGLMEDLDPEEATAIVEPVLEIMVAAVHRYEGFVARSTGDGIFALFGAPIACEDHAQRAIAAGLRMQGEIERHSVERNAANGAPLAIRVGINTGEVVLRSIRKDDLRADYTSIGHSTNVAARLESLARPGSVLVSETTRQLAEGYFRFEPKGAVTVKGMARPVTAYEAVGVGPLRTRLEVAARRGLGKFVGRGWELAELRRALRLAKAGQGQVIGVAGEAGVGKSRIVHELKREAEGCLVLEARGVSHGGAYPYLPLVELLNEYLGIASGQDEEARTNAIRAKVLRIDGRLGTAVPYIASFLGGGQPGAALAPADPHTHRRTLEAVKRLLLADAPDRPVVLVFEDVHWMDPESMAFVEVLARGLDESPLLLLLTYRPEYRLREPERPNRADEGANAPDDSPCYVLDDDDDVTAASTRVARRRDPEARAPRCGPAWDGCARRDARRTGARARDLPGRRESPAGEPSRGRCTL